jgi:antitoxin (DNA-binding transcriptional repressor) of toxin-antitoxin stability system
MAPTIHISEAEAARDFAELIAQVRAGAEVIIESEAGKLPVAVIHAPVAPRHTLAERIALLSEDSPAVMDAEFARDIEAGIGSHREPLEPPVWD